MPTVPRYQQQIREQGLPNERMSDAGNIEAFGGGQSAGQLTNAIQGLSNDVVKYAQEETKKADELRLSEMRRKLNDWEISTIYDPKTGAITRRGKDAFGLPEELTSAYDKFIADSEKELSTETQRMAFKQVADSRREAIARWTSDHVLKQTQLVEEQEFEASIESSKERASVDAKHAGVESAFVRNQAIARAQRLGLEGESLKQFVQAHESDLHGRVINQMIASNQDLAAKAYFERVKDLIDPDVAVKLQRPLTEVSLRGESQRIALELTKKYPIERSKEALADVDKMTQNPELQDLVRQRLWSRYDEQVKADKMAKEVNFENVINTLYDDRRRDAITPQQWDLLTPPQKKAAESLLKQQTTVTDMKKYTELRMMATEPATREKFLETHPGEYLSFLASKEYKEILKLWTDARKGNTSKLDGFLSEQRIIDERLASKKIDPRAEPTTKHGKIRNAVSIAVNQMAIEHQLSTGKKPTIEELQRWTDFQTMEVVVDGWLWDSTKRVVELTPDDEIVNLVVPDAEMDKIIEALKKTGRPVSQKSIYEWYIKVRKK